MTEHILTVLVGLVIGLTLGALGGGGSILTVPALVYLLGQSGQSASTASLVIVGTTSLIGMISYARDRRVHWLAGLTFGAAGIASSYLGTRANRQVPESVLLTSFAALMVAVGVLMLLKSRRHRSTRTGSGDGDHPPASQPKSPTRWRTSAVVHLIAAGLVVGFLTGFLGVGGGFLIVPALTMALDMPMVTAVGTSLLVIAINSAMALTARLQHPALDWSVIVPVTVAAVFASLVGKLIGTRIPSRILTRSFAVLVIAVAGYMGLRAV